MTTISNSDVLTSAAVQDWLIDKLAVRLNVTPETIDVHQVFDEFDLDSTEALILAGELEKWLGFELETTALWYHPTVADLSEYIAEEFVNNASDD
jgi:acyl carrier protein